MSETNPRSVLASHVDCVSALIRAGEPFGVVEDAIDELADLTTDQKAALWLFAFSLRRCGCSPSPCVTNLSSSWTQLPT